MSYKDTLTFASNTTDSGSITDNCLYDSCTTTGGTGDIYMTDNKYWEFKPPALLIGDSDVEKSIRELNKFKERKEEEDMRYLYEVILVNPINDAYEIYDAAGKNETSALFEAYNLSQSLEESEIKGVEFDDLKTQCRVLMEWKKVVDTKEENNEW